MICQNLVELATYASLVALAAGQQQRQQPRVLPPDGASAGRGHDRGERAHPARVQQGHGLRDHPAHGDPDDVRRVEARGGPAGRCRRRPGRRGCTAAGRPCRRSSRRRAAGDPGAHAGGAPGVPVVVADHEEARVGEPATELGTPPRHRPTEAHHQQQRLGGRVPEGLEADVDARSDVRDLLLEAPAGTAACARSDGLGIALSWRLRRLVTDEYSQRAHAPGPPPGAVSRPARSPAAPAAAAGSPRAGSR